MWSEHKNEHEMDICKCYGTYKIKEEVKIDDEKELRLRDELNPNCRSFANCTRLYALHTHWYACSVYMFVSLCLPYMCMTSVYSYLFDYFLGGERSMGYGEWMANVYSEFCKTCSLLLRLIFFSCYVQLNGMSYNNFSSHFFSLHAFYFFSFVYSAAAGEAKLKSRTMMSNPVYLTSEVVSEQIPLWFCMYAVAFRACVDEREWWRDRIDVCSASFCAQFNQWARHLISFIWCRVVRCLDAVWSWHVYMYLMFSKQEEIKWLLFLMTTESTLVGPVLIIIFGLWTYDFGLMTPKGVDNSNPLQSATMHNTASVRHTHTNSLAHSQCDNNLKGVFAESQTLCINKDRRSLVLSTSVAHAIADTNHRQSDTLCWRVTDRPVWQARLTGLSILRRRGHVSLQPMCAPMRWTNCNTGVNAIEAYDIQIKIVAGITNSIFLSHRLIRMMGM